MPKELGIRVEVGKSFWNSSNRQTRGTINLDVSKTVANGRVGGRDVKKWKTRRKNKRKATNDKTIVIFQQSYFHDNEEEMQSYVLYQSRHILTRRKERKKKNNM